MARCPNPRCKDGWIILAFPVLTDHPTRGPIVTDHVPCEACDGTGTISCCDGAVGGPREVANAGDPHDPASL